MRTVPVIFARNRSTVSDSLSSANVRRSQPDASPARRYVAAGRQARRQRRAARRCCSPGSTSAQLWASARQASVPWLLAALAVYAVNVFGQRLALAAAARRAGRPRPLPAGCSARSWSPPSSTISCRATSAATSSASATRRGRAGSKTLATTVVLIDRVLGLMGLVLVAALGATVGRRRDGWQRCRSGRRGCGRASCRRGRVGAGAARAGRLRTAAPAADGVPPGMGRRPHRDAHRGAGAIPRSPAGALAGCFGGAVFVQAATRGLLLRGRARAAPRHALSGTWRSSCRSRSSSRCCRSR